MGVKVATKADLAVIKLSGNFVGDRETGKLRQVFKQLVADGNLKLIIDLGKVHLMDSMAIGTMAQIRANYDKRVGRVILVDLDGNDLSMLIVMMLARIFEIGPDMAGALAKFETSEASSEVR
jgi:anti-anti-sigma factor